MEHYHCTEFHIFLVYPCRHILTRIQSKNDPHPVHTGNLKSPVLKLKLLIPKNFYDICEQQSGEKTSTLIFSRRETVVFSEAVISFRKCVLEHFAKFTGNHLCRSLVFDNIVSLRSATLLKRRLRHRCFPVNSAKFLRAPFIENLRTTASALS